MKRRIFSLLLAAVVAAALLPVPAALADSVGEASTAVPPVNTGISGSRMKSGSLDEEPLSQAAIVRLLKNVSGSSAQGNAFTEAPSCRAPYALGTVDPAVLQTATDRLNALRTLAGLPAVVLDAGLSRSAQYGAVLLGAAGSLSYAPARPAGMSDEFYRQGTAATSSSNIHMGTRMLPIDAVNSFMDDSDAANAARLGHRRWQLSPTLGKVGFGYAVSDVKTFYGLPYGYTTEKVFDRSGKGCRYNFIAWPASGYFPAGEFGGSTCWSVTLNPEVYAQPSLANVTVTLIRERDGRTWTFSGRESYQPAGSGKYFNVDAGGYGVNNCIIFRPDGVDVYDGLYTVRISGLRDKSGKALSVFSYQTCFFDEATYRDTAPSEWAVEEVDGAVRNGLVPLDLREEYRGAISRWDFCRLMIELVEERTGMDIDAYLSRRGLTITDPFVDTDSHEVLAAYALGIVNGRSATEFVPNGAITRQEAAAMLGRTARVLGLKAARSAASFTDAGDFADWAAGEIAFVSALTDPATGRAVMNGVGEGRFDPQGAYTREQAFITAQRLFNCR